MEIFRMGIFRVGVFMIPKKICEEFSSVHALTVIFIKKSSFFKPIVSMFSSTPIIIFSYGVEIFPHPLVQLIGRVSALIGYIEM